MREGAKRREATKDRKIIARCARVVVETRNHARYSLSLSLPLRNSSHLCVFVRNKCGISEKEGELHADPNYASASGGEITVNAP